MWGKDDSRVQALTVKRMNYMAPGRHTDPSSIPRGLLDDVRGFLQRGTVASEATEKQAGPDHKCQELNVQGDTSLPLNSLCDGN